jgi:hypothetical protein
MAAAKKPKRRYTLISVTSRAAVAVHRSPPLRAAIKQSTKKATIENFQTRTHTRPAQKDFNRRFC